MVTYVVLTVNVFNHMRALKYIQYRLCLLSLILSLSDSQNLKKKMVHVLCN